MSEDTFAKCVALKIVKPLVDEDELHENLYDYLDETYGSYVYSAKFGKDFIALYHDQNFEECYGIHRIDVSKDFADLRDILATMCVKHGIEINSRPKYFTDFWYNGCDCSVVDISWEDL